MIYLNGKNPNRNGYVNIREYPNLNASRKRFPLPSTGTLAKYNANKSYDGSYYWHEFTFPFYEWETGWIREDVFMMTQPLQTTIIDVPYHSQNDPNSSLFPNDCGPASIAMMLAYGGVETTVNEVAVLAGMQGNLFTDFGQLIKAASYFGFRADYQRPFYLSNVIEKLHATNNPVLVLVNYDILYPGKRYGHFVVVTGYKYKPDLELNIVYHDPNRYPSQEVNWDRFAKAIAYKGSSANMPFQAVTLQYNTQTNATLQEIKNQIAVLNSRLTDLESFVYERIKE